MVYGLLLGSTALGLVTIEIERHFYARDVVTKSSHVFSRSGLGDGKGAFRDF